MASEATIYLPTIEENLFGGLEPIRMSGTDDSAFILDNGKTVDLPQAGTHGSITKGNTSYPVTIADRSDADVTYSLTNVEIDPIRNTAFTQNNASYNRFASIINDATSGLGYWAARYILTQWYPGIATANSVNTTGTATYTTQCPGGSEVVKSVDIQDIINCALILDKQVIPRDDGRNLILNASMYNSIFSNMSDNDYLNFASRNLKTGLVDSIHGFKVIMMADTLNITVGGVVSDPDISPTGTTTSKSVGLAFHKSAVSYAMGDVNVFLNDGDAPNYGDVLSGTVFAGGKYRRTGKEGIVSLVETT